MALLRIATNGGFEGFHVFWATFDKGMPFCLQRRQRVVVVVLEQPGLHYAMSIGWIQ